MGEPVPVDICSRSIRAHGPFFWKPLHNPGATSPKPNNWTHKPSRNPYKVVSIGVSEQLQRRSAMTNTPIQRQSGDWMILNSLFIAKPFTGASSSINNSEGWSLFPSLCASDCTQDDWNHQKKKTPKNKQHPYETGVGHWSAAVGKQHMFLCAFILMQNSGFLHIHPHRVAAETFPACSSVWTCGWGTARGKGSRNKQTVDHIWPHFNSILRLVLLYSVHSSRGTSGRPRSSLQQSNYTRLRAYTLAQYCFDNYSENQFKNKKHHK